MIRQLLLLYTFSLRRSDSLNKKAIYYYINEHYESVCIANTAQGANKLVIRVRDSKLMSLDFE